MKTLKIKQLMSTGFFRDSLTLVSSMTAAKIIGLFLVPIVTRLYDPHDYGIVSVVLSISMIFGVVSALRYDQAIVLPDNEHTASQLVKLSTAIVMLAGMSLLVVSAVLIGAFPETPLIRDIGKWIFLVPLITVLQGMTNILANSCTRYAQYKTLGLSEIAVSLVTGGSRIAGGVVSGTSVAGLAIGSLLGFVAKIYILVGALLRRGKALDPQPEFHGYRELARGYRAFPVYSAPTGLLNTTFQKMPVIILGILFLPGVVGLYAMASRMGRLPIDMISLPIRRIYMQRIARLKNQGRPMKGALVKTSVGLLVLGSVPFLIVAVFGEELFGFVLGAKWTASGAYASLLVPWLFSIFVVTPASSNYVILKRQPLWLKLQIIIGLVGLGALLLGYILALSPEHVIFLFSVAGMTTNLGVLFIAYRITSGYDRSTPAA